MIAYRRPMQSHETDTGLSDPRARHLRLEPSRTGVLRFTVADATSKGHLYEPQKIGTRAMRRLGEALASGRQLTGDEKALYAVFATDAMDRTTACTEAVRTLFQQQDVKAVLPRVAAANVTGRPKTRKTLVEKLLRTPEIKLPAVHDVAGVRLVGSFSIFEQQQAAAIIQQAFDRQVDVSKPSQLVNRLERPSHGYRALHVVVWPEGRPVEIQIRTDVQHAWAELMEVLGDRWGREPRYGEPVVHADDQERDRRQSVVDQLIAIADNIAEFEDASRGAGLAHVHPPVEVLESPEIDAEAVSRAQEHAREAEPQIEAMKQNLLRVLAQFGVDADLESDR